jgi:GTPase SAR1 family protein
LLAEAKGSEHCVYLLKPVKAELRLDQKDKPQEPDEYLNPDETLVLMGKCPCENESSRCYNLVVVGLTGSGKTTLINSMTNFLMGIEF